MKTIRLEGFVGWDIRNSDLVRELPADPTEPVHIFIDSYGGDAFEGFALFNTLFKRDNVTVEIGARAMSAASYIPFAADKVLVSKVSTWMAHNAQTFAYGNKAELRRELTLLEGIDDIIVDIYAGHIKNMDRETIISKMDEEFWLFGGQSIIDAGIAHELVSSKTSEGGPDADPAEVINSFRALFNEKMSHKPDTHRDWTALNVILESFTKGKEVNEVDESKKTQEQDSKAVAMELPAGKEKAIDNYDTKAEIAKAVANEQERILQLLSLGNVTINDTIHKAIVENMSQGDYAIAQLEANKATVAPVNAENIAPEPAKPVDEVAKSLKKDDPEQEGTRLFNALWPKQ